MAHTVAGGVGFITPVLLAPGKQANGDRITFRLQRRKEQAGIQTAACLRVRTLYGVARVRARVAMTGRD
jgi:hypothetical protein